MENNNETIQPDVRLGKLPAKSSMKALFLSDFAQVIDKAVVLPKETNFWARRSSFPVRTFGNTKYGSCTRSKQAVAAMRMERLETRQTPEITDEEVIRVYVDMSRRLYGGGDNGAYEIDALSEWRKPDLTFRDTKGRPLTIDAFLKVNHSDINAVKEAIHLSGAHGLAVCLNLPLAWSKVHPPNPWDLPEGQPMIGEYMPGSWGGHSMFSSDYDERGLYVEHTWGMPRQLVTWRAAAAYMDESFMFIDSLNSWRKRHRLPLKVSEAIKEAVNSVSSQKIK